MPPSKTKLQKKRQIGLLGEWKSPSLPEESPLDDPPVPMPMPMPVPQAVAPPIELLCPPTPGHKEIEPGPSENNRAPTVNFVQSGGKHFIAESLRAAVAQGKNATYAWSIRRWIRTLITTGDLPYFHHGWWNVPMLGDEDIGHEIKTHLQAIGKYACAEAIVQFFSDKETRTRLGVPKAICLRTAQRWMTKYGGFRWRTKLKGQYIDGHERANVVEYCKKTYVTFMKAIERLTTIYNEHGVPDPEQPILIFPGEKPIIVWFHDKSTFFANDRQIVWWLAQMNIQKPVKKEREIQLWWRFCVCTVRVVTGEKWGIRTSHSQAWINRDGWFTSARVVKQLEDAVKIVQEVYPEYTHVFVYDNAPSHTKRPEDAISAQSMPKGEVKVFPRPVTVNREMGQPRRSSHTDGTRAIAGRYSPVVLFADDHEDDFTRRQKKKQSAQASSANLAGRLLLSTNTLQPTDFESRDSNLEEAPVNSRLDAGDTQNEKYAQKPPTNNENMMKKYVIEALESIPIDTIRKFVLVRSVLLTLTLVGNNGEMAIEWATKAFRSHRQTPGHIPYKQIALGYVHTQDNAYIG
ncbi:hypothetical protein RHS01_10591 [Rhizoctonia solani]|uniref:Uncharacterized protein n=1 Tax=Rhizoctonia solani TaxID=456999 RepID=A0A8H7I3M6_9AGAM|nr:hypothetical protein RHS01_10591 [Rhizoctonia solani]